MNEVIDLMAAPLVACLILTGIHTYLGLHVIKRGVIFVDLALAQLAALGATLGFLAGYGLHSTQGYLFSLGLTLVGAIFFAFTRLKKQVVPQEALIGIVYAVAGAAMILGLSAAPEGGEELKALLVGHLLYIDWQEIVTVLLLYTPIALFHWYFRKFFLAISEDPAAAQAQGISVRCWDFLFYASFGIVVTSSVEMAGVLLVFCFLIVPAVCGAFLATSIIAKLLVGWFVSLVTSLLGLLLSYQLDTPTGATIVCVFGLAALVCYGLRQVGVRVG